MIELHAVREEIFSTAADAAVFFYAEEQKMEYPGALGAKLKEALRKKQFCGKSEEVFICDGLAAVERVFVVGLGKAAAITLDSLRLAMAVAIRTAKRFHCETVVVKLPEINVSETEVSAALADGVLLAAYEFSGLRKKDETKKYIQDVTFCVTDTSLVRPVLRRASVILEAVWQARDMVNLPANVVNPSYLEKKAQAIAKLNSKITLQTISFAEAKKMGMGGFCGVAQGSDEPAKLLVLEYTGSAKDTIALVGKGVTFDSGGISLKPATNMREMKMDMSGAALVLAVFQILAQLKPKTSVLGIIPAVENLPSGHAYRPGDVLKFLNGRTAEVVSTDAEGRLILADALCLAQDKGAKKIIDFATLTGAVIVALGHTRAGIMSNDQAFANDYLQAALKSGERHWQLPMDEEYFEPLKSDVADSLNNSEDRVAGTIAGGKFLEKFIEKNTSWIHCDIAGTAWMPKAQSYWDKNATGFGIRTVAELLDI